MIVHGLIEHPMISHQTQSAEDQSTLMVKKER